MKTSARMLSSKRMKPGRTAASLVVGQHKEEEQAKHRPAASCQRSLQSPPRTAGSRLGTGIARLRYQCEVACGLAMRTCYTSRFPSPKSSRQRSSGFSHLWLRGSRQAFLKAHEGKCHSWPKGTLLRSDKQQGFLCMLCVGPDRLDTCFMT